VTSGLLIEETLGRNFICPVYVILLEKLLLFAVHDCDSCCCQLIFNVFGCASRTSGSKELRSCNKGSECALYIT